MNSSQRSDIQYGFRSNRPARGWCDPKQRVFTGWDTLPEARHAAYHEMSFRPR
jgi:hypothetical protein